MRKVCLFSLVLLLALSSSAVSKPAPAFTAVPTSGQTITILKGDGGYIDFSLGAWKANWGGYCSFKGDRYKSGDAAMANNVGTMNSAKLSLNSVLEKSGKRQLTLKYDLSTSEDVGVTLVMAGANLNANAFAGGSVVVETVGGEPKTIALPLGKQGLGENIRRCTLIDRNGNKTKLSFKPACEIATDNQLRILLAKDELKKSEPSSLTITIDLPDETVFYADAADYPAGGIDDWYTFEPTLGAGDGEIGLSDWIETPAGKHGRIVRKGDDLIYNGKPIKLWGINVTYSACAPAYNVANQRAAFYAKNGINAVRLHKYAQSQNMGIQSANSVLEFDAGKLEKMDYFIAALKERGIYTKLSSNFMIWPGEAERDRIPYFDELGTMTRGRMKTKHGTIFLSRELQDLQIEQMVNLLEHKNSHTGDTYAEDPAIVVIELFNEDSALFYGTKKILQTIPTLRKRAGKQFTDWLIKRYGNEEALIAAWGSDSLNSFVNEGFTHENWEEKTILPVGDPWFFDPDQLKGTQSFRRQRLLDTMLFLYEIQNDFYARFVKAIHDTGYDGEIISSNWQAGRAFSHYLNLYSDSQVGLIDRHNYFGGSKIGKINTASMLRIPGSGMLSAGMQQVGDRPFMFSEWIHVSPTEWGAEGVALIGAYGMGLQGWDVSFIFQTKSNGEFLNKIRTRGWNASEPQVMGLFPAVARQVLRGDIKESNVVAPRYVHVPSLHEAKLGFNDQVTQEHDVKTFNSDKVPAEALAAARCTIDFTDTYRDTPAFDMTPYLNNGGITSSTRELFWKKGESKMDGFFTIDTDATKAVVGFSQNQVCKLGDVTIEPHSRFSAIYVTAKEIDKTLKTSDNLLVVAIARARNTGMQIMGDDILLSDGASPVVMEPVKATITLKRKAKEVTVLDHDGNRTLTKLPIKNGTFEIDGTVDKTCYYLITF